MTHAELVDRAARWLRTTRRCTVVLTERYVGAETIEIPDAIGWDSRGRAIVVECKVSRADYLADLRKPCRRREPEFSLGRERFYLTPPGLLESVGVPGDWGLLEAGPKRIRVVQVAAPFVSSRELETRLLVSELSRYQIHGITYPPLTRPDAEGEVVTP